MGDELASVRPRLRADAYAVPTEAGALVHTNRGTEAFTGATIGGWLDRLAPHLDGRTTLGELVGPLPPDKQDMVRRIVVALRDRGLVRDGGEAVPPRPEIGYLDAFVGDAGEAHRGFQTAELVVAGDGPLLDQVVRLLGEAGATSVTAVHGGDEVTVRANDRPLLRAVPRAGRLWIHAGDASSAAWRRARRWLDSDKSASPPSTAGWRPEAVTLAAATIGLAAFRLLTGVADAQTLICLDLASLEATTHRALPWPAPAGPDHEPTLAARTARLAALPALDPETLDRAGARLVDARVGVLGEVSERDFVQLPVNVAAATVAGRPRPVIGAGPSVSAARWRAILAGLASYAASTVDPDRLVGGRVRGWRLADGTARRLPVDAVFTAPDAVPAGADLPGVAAARTWSGAVTAALLDWCARLTATEHLVSRGRPHPADLFATAFHAAGRFTVKDRLVSQSWPHLAAVDPRALDADDEATAYLRMIDILGIPLRVHDVTGPLRVPTLAFGTGDRTLAYVSGLRAADTLPAGLLAVLLDHQAATGGQPDYAPRSVPQLPAGSARPPVRAPGPARIEPLPPLELGDVVDALRCAGFDPIAVPLDHDPELARLVPFIVRVVPGHD